MTRVVNPERLFHTEFPQIDQAELRAEILDKSQHYEAREGDTILNFNELIQAVPLVLSGSLKVLRNDNSGHEILLYYVRPGECCAMKDSGWVGS